LLRNLDNIYPNIKALLQQLHNTDLGSLIGLGAGAANAFFCGILNSLIDALNGLLWIFKLGSQLAVKLQEIRLDFRDTFLKFLEYIDSLRKAIQAFDFGKIWKALLQHIKHFIQELPQASIYELSYFAGAAVGFIITIVVEIVLGLLLTGGAITVAIIVEELLKIVRSTAQFARKVSSTAAELLKNAGKIATSTMQKALTQLLRFFQQGTDNILKILDDFFSALRKGGDEVVDVISRLFNDVAKGIAKSKGDLNKTFFENAGKKVSKYVTSTRLLGQTTDHTCVAASLRMVLKDKAIIRSEEELARVLKTDINGARLMDIPEALYQKRLDEQVSAIFEKNIKLPKLIEKLQEGDMAIVSVFDEGIGSHAMVLEKIEDGKVFLKDPLPIKKGASYSVSIDDFEKIFKENAVIIKK
jgi:hypothetical protein